MIEDGEQQKTHKILQAFVDNPGFLHDTGWLSSMSKGEAVNADGEPIPWMTYPAIDFLDKRISSEMEVFEYGTGNSTLWWGARVARLVSCEHDKEWFATFQAKVTRSNTTYMLRRTKGGATEYCDEVSNYPAQFDILVIDGRDRVRCIFNGLASLKKDGVVIWDNSDRAEYQEGYDLLLASGFKRIDFWGPGPLATRRWCTTIFYRAENCLGI